MLWAKTLDSSVWRRENKETRLVWITLLMMKDSEGIVQSSRVGLADRARVSDGECEEALRVLIAPDLKDTSGVQEGRRIREVPGGWQIVNHDMYRFSTEAKREFWRQEKAKQRQGGKRAKKPVHGPVKTREEQVKDKASRDGVEVDGEGWPVRPACEDGPV